MLRNLKCEIVEKNYKYLKINFKKLILQKYIQRDARLHKIKFYDSYVFGDVKNTRERVIRERDI